MLKEAHDVGLIIPILFIRKPKLGEDTLAQDQAELKQSATCISLYDTTLKARKTRDKVSTVGKSEH